MTFTVINGNNIDVLKNYPDNHFDSVVTDPPYGIDFLGKDWDANTGALETYEQCLRVLKPGGYLLAFSAARTYHHLAVTVERAGFDIRDQIMWIYGSGFPKSQDVGRQIQKKIGVKETKKNPNARTLKGNSLYSNSWQKEVAGDNVVCTDPQALQWSGWGTCLKPAHEPIVMARKPTRLSFAQNVETWNTGALNIDATRVGDSIMPVGAHQQTGSLFKPNTKSAFSKTETKTGRFPSNVIGEVEQEYQKYFYSPKVSRKERHIGFDTADIPQIGSTHPDDVKKHPLWDSSIGGDAARLKQKIIDSGQYSGNIHPTVKPVALMEYLIKLVTPQGGLVLDPFNGSGSTGMAAVGLGYDYVGIDLDPNYVDISIKRIEAWVNRDLADNTFDELFEESDETE